MSTTPSRRPARIAGPVLGLVLAAATLSGCGVSSPLPGVAAEVGATRISAAHVDELATGYCSAVKPQLAGQFLPLRYLRGGVAGQLALEAAARQFAAEQGVAAGQDYRQALQSLQTAVKGLPEAEQQAVIEVESAAAYVTSVQQAAGEKLLREQGDASPTPTDAEKAGSKAFADWLDQHPVTFDPKYGMTIEDGKPVPTDTSLSYAVSKAAVTADAGTPDQGYASGLPSAHRCG